MAELDGFPGKGDLQEVWFREHGDRPAQADRGCWWFSGTKEGASPEGRFDLPLPNGTLYLGETVGVVVRERCGRFLAAHEPIPQTHLDGRVVTTVALPTFDGSVADTTSPEAARFGVTGELASGNDYELTSAWARALFAAGCEGGIYYSPRFTPGHEYALGLFGRTAARDWPVEVTVPLAEALSSIGYRVQRSRIPSSPAAATDDTVEPEDA